MLVLSRKLGQSFCLGPDVRVTVVKIDRNSVRIGIEAPGEVPIQREEIVFELPHSYPAQAGAESFAIAPGCAPDWYLPIELLCESDGSVVS